MQYTITPLITQIKANCIRVSAYLAPVNCEQSNTVYFALLFHPYSLLVEAMCRLTYLTTQFGKPSKLSRCTITHLKTRACFVDSLRFILISKIMEFSSFQVFSG